MGIVDFDSVFDLLDPAQHGYVTWEQVRQYDEVLHLTPLDPMQVKAAVQQVWAGVDKHLCLGSILCRLVWT